MNAIRDWAREHPGLSGLVVALALCVVAEAVLWAHWGTLRRHVDDQKQTLDRMEELAAEYETLRAQADAYGARLSESASFSLPALQRVAPEGLGDRITESSFQTNRRDEGLVERVVTLKLDGVSRKALAEYLLAAERLDPAIRTKTLKLAPSKEDPEFLDATVTFSAYEETPNTAE